MSKADVSNKHQTDDTYIQDGKNQTTPLLKGTIIQIDTENDLVSISIGSSAGIKKDSQFYVVRGEQFICQITIVDLDLDTAVGIISLKVDFPKVGDRVTNKLQ